MLFCLGAGQAVIHPIWEFPSTHVCRDAILFQAHCRCHSQKHFIVGESIGLFGSHSLFLHALGSNHQEGSEPNSCHRGYRPSESLSVRLRLHWTPRVRSCASSLILLKPLHQCQQRSSPVKLDSRPLRRGVVHDCHQTARWSWESGQVLVVHAGPLRWYTVRFQ